MSTSHDGQYGPAQIVWQDTAPGAPAAWAGPGAFEPESDAAANDASPQSDAAEQGAPSLSSAWASWSQPADEQAPVEQPSAPQPVEQPSAPQPVEQQPVEQQGGLNLSKATGGHDSQAEPSSDSNGEQAPSGSHAAGGAAVAGASAGAAAGAASAGWVTPGSAQTADEVHQDWSQQQPAAQSFDPSATMQHSADEEAPTAQDRPDPYASQPPQSSSPASPAQGAYDPYTQPRHEQSQPGDQNQNPQGQNPQNQNPQNQGSPDYSGMAYPSTGSGQSPAAGSYGQAPAGQAPANPAQAAPTQQTSNDAQDAWAAHHQGLHADEPMTTDPSAGEAIPTPPEAPAAGTNQTDEPADDEALTIGRSRDNSIVLDDMLVSRRHLRITADDEGLLLEDLGSRNGTYVNGRRVERAHLQEGDRIGVGGTTFEVRNDWLVTI